MFVRSSLEGDGLDCIGIRVICDHDILVAASGLEWEASRVISIQLADMVRPKVELIGLLTYFPRLGRKCRPIYCIYSWTALELEWPTCWPGGSDILPRLHHMSLEGLVRHWTVFCCIFVGEARPRVEMPRLDC